MRRTLEPGFAFGGWIDPEAGKNETPGSDRYWMKEALRESFRSVGISNPNPAVGCVIVKNGKEICRGHTQAYRGKHAERSAIEKLSDLSVFEGATAYVTLEPCAHHGNQPPCADILASLPLARVVIGRRDPNPKVNGAGLRRLVESGKQTLTGVFENEITAWNFPFFAQLALGRPVVALKWAQTLDGQLADDAGVSQWISGPAARAYTHGLRQRYDAIVVGAGTYLADLPRLTVRDCAGPIQAQPLRVVLDPKGRCFGLRGSEEERFRASVEHGQAPFVLIAPETALAAERDGLEWLSRQSNARVLTVPEGLPALSPDWITTALDRLAGEEVVALRGRPLQSLLVEGGAVTLTAFVKAGRADVIHSFVSPKLTGGSRHRVELKRTLSSAACYDLVASNRLASDVLIEVMPAALADQLFVSREEL
jgi:diaminohydroxyphosphoribosylaminopyrimidine deaminase/5-amino-6-(5-phosphoribosylamino)uracil reductase